jgi:hypothetical protein
MDTFDGMEEDDGIDSEIKGFGIGSMVIDASNGMEEEDDDSTFDGGERILSIADFTASSFSSLGQSIFCLFRIFGVGVGS